VITTIAGDGRCQYSGDNGPATSAQLCMPNGVVVDSAGNLYVADTGNHRIRKVSNGVITTVAGNGTRGYSGDNGPATSAQLNLPSSVAVDSAGNLYITDIYSNRVRKVSNGVITTFAGSGAEEYWGDNGPATNAGLKRPSRIAIDSAGNLYIADTGHYRIRKVSNGVITTIAGNGSNGYFGDNGPATSAALSEPRGIALDALGNVYFTDSTNQRVRVLTPGASSCRQSVSTTDLGVAAAGGTLALSIQTDSNCAWSLSGLPAWLTVSGSSQGIGPAIVNLVANANAGGSRTGLVAVGSVSVPIRQVDAAACGGSSSCVVRSLPHLAFGGEWTTVLSAVSSGTGEGSYSISFYGDNGASVALPFTGWLGNLSRLTDSVPAQGMQYYEAENPSAPVQAGWGLVATDASVTFHAILRRRTADGHFYGAAVPSSGGYSTFVVPFDATTFAPAGMPMFIGLAINNFNPSVAANVVCTARDQLGAILPNAISIPSLSPLGHYSDYKYPALTGKRGTLTCTADTLVSAIALRSIGSDAFSTLPVIVK
jgi:sugar lactone lactonase YvrE